MAGPAGRITAVTATTFTATFDSVTGTASTTARLQTRALGSAADWTTQASNATPAAGIALQATGLTTGTSLEARIIQETGAGAIEDGTHFIVTPASSIWATLLSEVETTLEGSGITAAEKGTELPPSPPPIAALLRTLPEEVAQRGNNAVEITYPIEVELRLIETSDTGEQRTEDMATYQRMIISSFDQKTAADFPSIAGLYLVTVEIRSKDEASRAAEQYEDETRARAVIRFRVIEDR